MKVYRDLTDLPVEALNCVIAIGNFDSVHKGHLSLIEEAKNLAHSLNKKSALLTFDPHPFSVLNPESEPINLFYEEHKIQKIKERGVDFLFILKFDQKISSLSPENFVKKILLDKLKISYLLVGDDFRFGSKRSGNKASLEKMAKKYRFGFSTVAIKSYGSLVYSSSSVRDFLRNGYPDQASIILGYEYFIDGKIIPGNQNGRKIGFKTANIKPQGLFLPKKGVYASYATVEGFNKRFKSITNLGLRPTVDEQELLEVHLFDFDEDIYYKNIKVYLKKYIRPQIKFNNLEELKKQIEIDVQKTKEILER